MFDFVVPLFLLLCVVLAFVMPVLGLLLYPLVIWIALIVVQIPVRFLLRTLSGGKIDWDLGIKNGLILFGIVGILISIWIFFPLKPLKLDASEIAQINYDTLYNDVDQTLEFTDKDVIQEVVNSLNGYTYHRSFSKKRENIESSGFVLIFFDENGNEIQKLQLCDEIFLGTVLENKTVYYETYPILGSEFDHKGLVSILDKESKRETKELNQEAFKALHDSATYENGALSFTLPTFNRKYYGILSKVHGVIHFVNGGATKKDVYFLKDEISNRQWKSGDVVTVELESDKYYEFDVEVTIDGFSYKIDLSDVLNNSSV